MTTPDYPKALAAAREAHTYVKHLGMTRAEAALGDLLAALDAQVPDGRIHQDGFFSWAGTSESEHRQKDRLLPCDFYLAPVAPAAAVPAGYVPVSALIEAREEVESWAAYATPYFQDKHDLAEVLAKIDGQIAAAQAQQPADAWINLYRRAVDVANDLTNYVEDRPKLLGAERKLDAIENEARALIATNKENNND